MQHTSPLVMLIPLSMQRSRFALLQRGTKEFGNLFSLGQGRPLVASRTAASVHHLDAVLQTMNNTANPTQTCLAALPTQMYPQDSETALTECLHSRLSTTPATVLREGNQAPPVRQAHCIGTPAASLQNGCRWRMPPGSLHVDGRHVKGSMVMSSANIEAHAEEEHTRNICFQHLHGCVDRKARPAASLQSG